MPKYDRTNLEEECIISKVPGASLLEQVVALQSCTTEIRALTVLPLDLKQVSILFIRILAVLVVNVMRTFRPCHM